MLEKSASIIELTKALLSFQAKVEPIAKTGLNPHFKSKYVTLSSVWEQVRPILTECRLTLAQHPTGNGDLTTLLVHESGEFVQSTTSMFVPQNNPQGVGSAITYMRRYAACAILGIVADEDDDGNAASAPPAQAKPAYSRVAQAKPSEPRYDDEGII